jgi:hypothetical protein
MSDSNLEKMLKGLLEKVIGEVKFLLRSKEDLKELEPLLEDYEDTLQLGSIISSVAELYFRKVMERLAMTLEDEYRSL